jgi:hypothetical protein
VVIAGGAAGFMTGTDKTKLDGIATGATVNQTDAYLLNRANHTGTQSITTTTFGTTSKIAGRISAGSGIAEELTGTQVTSLLDIFGASKGLVPGTPSNTTNFLRADGTWATPPNTGVWGSITGTLSAQTDLQAALDSKLFVTDDLTWGAGYLRTDTSVEGLTVGDNAIEGSATFTKGTATNPGGIEFDAPNFTGGGTLGGMSPNNRVYVATYGTITGFEFTSAPYVGTNVVYHAGNLTIFTASTNGLVPKPVTATGTKYLRDDGTWQTVDTSFHITATGTGVSQNITLPQSVANENNLFVFVNGLMQTPVTDYTVSGTTLTITTDNSGDSIMIRKPF